MPKLTITRITEPPEGFSGDGDFTSEGEEIALLNNILPLPFKNFLNYSIRFRTIKEYETK